MLFSTIVQYKVFFYGGLFILLKIYWDITKTLEKKNISKLVHVYCKFRSIQLNVIFISSFLTMVYSYLFGPHLLMVFIRKIAVLPYYIIDLGGHC